ncbi:MAG: DUF748 domain-containing protein [Desulfosarcina sp.]
MDFLKKIIRSKPFIICAVVLVFYTLAGFFLAPWLVKHYVPKIVQDQIKKQALIGKVRINPYLFKVEATDFRMQEVDGQPIASFKRLFVDFELKSLFKWAWTFRQVRLEGPHVNAVIAKDGTLNLTSLAPPSEAGSQPSVKDQAPPRLIIEDIAIDGGEIDLTDRRQSDPATISLRPLQLQVNNLSTLRGEKGPHSITANLGDGGTLRCSGDISVHPVESNGSFAIENVQAATAWKFIRDAVAIAQPNGTASISADYRVSLSGVQPQAMLDQLAVAISGLSLHIEGEAAPFFEISDARLTGGRLDLEQQQVDIEKLMVAGGHVRITVDESGILNLNRIVRSPKNSVPAPPVNTTAGSAKPWTLNLAAFDLSGLAADYQDHSRTPGLNVGVGEIKMALKAQVEAGGQIQAVVNDIGVDVSGFRAAMWGDPEPELQIQRIGLEGGVYDLQPNDFRIETVSVEGGAVDLKRLPDGAINLALMFAPPQKGAIARETDDAAAQGHPFQFLAQTIALSDFQVKFSDLTVKPEAPMINLEDMAVALANVDGKSPMTFEAGFKVREGGRIEAKGTVDPSGPSVESEVEVAELGLTAFQPYVSQAATIDIQSGTFSTRGEMSHGMKAAVAQTIYQGGFKLDNLRVTEKDGNETLVGWKSVQTDQLTMHLEPNRLDIGDLKVLNLIGKFIIDKDQSINLTKVIKSGPTAKTAEAASAQASPAGGKDAFPYRVGRILLSDGEMEFADLSLFTPFGTRVQQLKGVVAGLSSVENARAQVKLDGSVERYGTANVEGEFDASDPKRFTNISVVFRNLEMSTLTPYSGTFAGRKIDSGKLSVDLKYKIDKHQLEGDNQFVVERLTLGEDVESPDAVNLPLDLAVALLEDANGVIDLGLPVSGDLDSPEFSYGALIWKAVVNLLTKIVTSPFRALASLVPGGEEEAFNAVAFSAGRSDIPPPEKEKLAKLAGALQKRPQLKLDMQGRYNPETDRAELKSVGVRRALAARLGQDPDTAEDYGPVDFSSPETGQALEAMFSERLGADALAALKADQEAALEKAEKEPAAAKPNGDAATAAEEDPGQFARDLLERLVEVEPVDDAALVKLADDRAQAIVAELTDAGQLPSERIEVKPSAPDDNKDAVSAVLSLEAGR